MKYNFFSNFYIKWINNNLKNIFKQIIKNKGINYLEIFVIKMDIIIKKYKIYNILKLYIKWN